MVGDITKNLKKDFQNATSSLDWNKDITLSDLKDAFISYYVRKGKDASSITDEHIQKALIQQSTDYIIASNTKGCYLYKLLSSYRNRNGKFKSVEDLLNYCFTTFNITNKTIQNDYKKKFTSTSGDYAYMRKCLSEINIKSLVNLILD